MIFELVISHPLWKHRYEVGFGHVNKSCFSLRPFPYNDLTPNAKLPRVSILDIIFKVELLSCNRIFLIYYIEGSVILEIMLHSCYCTGLIERFTFSGGSVSYDNDRADTVESVCNSTCIATRAWSLEYHFLVVHFNPLSINQICRCSRLMICGFCSFESKILRTTSLSWRLSHRDNSQVDFSYHVCNKFFIISVDLE